MGALALGAMLATDATLIMTSHPIGGPVLAVVAFSLIGAGVGAAGTSLLALLASEVAPARRPAAAAMTWIMMIAGIAGTAGIAGQLIEPFTAERLTEVVAGNRAGRLHRVAAGDLGRRAAPPCPRPR